MRANSAILRLWVIRWNVEMQRQGYWSGRCVYARSDVTQQRNDPTRLTACSRYTLNGFSDILLFPPRAIGHTRQVQEPRVCYWRCGTNAERKMLKDFYEESSISFSRLLKYICCRICTRGTVIATPDPWWLVMGGYSTVRVLQDLLSFYRNTQE